MGFRRPFAFSTPGKKGHTCTWLLILTRNDWLSLPLLGDTCHRVSFIADNIHWQRFDPRLTRHVQEDVGEQTGIWRRPAPGSEPQDAVKVTARPAANRVPAEILRSPQRSSDRRGRKWRQNTFVFCFAKCRSVPAVSNWSVAGSSRPRSFAQTAVRESRYRDVPNVDFCSLVLIVCILVLASVWRNARPKAWRHQEAWQH